MKKPEPKDFGITQDQIYLVESKEQSLGGWFLWSGIATGLLAAVYLGLAYGIGIVALVVYLPIMGIALSRVVFFIINWLLKRFAPLHKGVAEYKSAVEAYNHWFTRTQQEFWLSLNGRMFETELARLYTAFGYRASLTPPSGDRGVDIVLEKDGKTTIVQCKAHKKPVGPHVVRDLHGAMINSNADEAILASISGFTKGVIAYVQDKPIRLVSLQDIIQMQKTIMD